MQDRITIVVELFDVFTAMRHQAVPNADHFIFRNHQECSGMQITMPGMTHILGSQAIFQGKFLQVFCMMERCRSGFRPSKIPYQFYSSSQLVSVSGATDVPLSAKALKSIAYFMDCFLNAPGIKKPIIFIKKLSN